MIKQATENNVDNISFYEMICWRCYLKYKKMLLET